MTDGTRSYAIYTYECGKLNWADRFAGIGFSASSNFFAEHPLSRNSGVNEIACINKDSIPSSNWNNIVYEINGQCHMHGIPRKQNGGYTFRQNRIFHLVVNSSDAVS